MKKSLTLVIAVYNAVRYLEYVLSALTRQTFRDFDIIVADDGSSPEIERLIARMSTEVFFPINHVWQPDRGFRKTAVLNRAIEAVQTDYIVFIDGDCLPHHDFLRDHWDHRSSNAVLCGRRVNLSRQITDRLKLEDITSLNFEKISLRLLIDGLRAQSYNLEDGMRIENPFIRRILNARKARILGCNFSLEKNLLEQINGFNEDYMAPGLGEDSDVAFRLGLMGASFVTLRYLAVLFHLYHPKTEVGEENKRIYGDVVAARNPICVNGLRKLDVEHAQIFESQAYRSV